MSLKDNVARLRPPRLTPRISAAALGAALVAVLAGAAVWAFFFSSWLSAQDVSVTGSSAVLSSDVQRAAAVSLGTPLARLDLDGIRARVQDIPEVRSAVVSRDWPHTVSIHIVERQPVAVVKRNGTWWSVDDDGHLFGDSPRRRPGLPMLVVPLLEGSDSLTEAASVAAALPSDLRRATGRLSATSMDSVTLHLRGHREVMWGSAADSDRKVEVLRALLLHTKASVYDVSVPEQPTTG